ncbi:MAG TPA: hypothetical protein VLY24_04370 [Bryobacteraceae bacterium]|nr:hypothetical protein [Bryobacteraceae bacterium]
MNLARLALFAVLAHSHPPFTVDASEDAAAEFPGAPRVQSFSFAQWKGRWVIIGGRTAGYHSVGGGSAEFLPTDANRQIWVLDTTQRPVRTYHVSLDLLPSALADVKDQWSAAGHAYFQDNSRLYICGGYGQDHRGKWVTFPIISQIDLPELIDGVTNGRVPARSIAYTTSPLVQSAGGELVKLPDGYFYLVMGHSFEGSYTSFEAQNEHNGAQAAQIYLNEIRKLKITSHSAGLIVTLTDKFTDEAEFHRRDFNLARVLSPQGLGFAVYGGVFTPETQLDYDKPIYYYPGSHPVVDSEFRQKLNTYSAAKLLLYDRAAGAMYTTFFGGISRHFWDRATGQFPENPKVGTKVSPTYFDGLEWTDQISIVQQTWAAGKTTTVESANPSALPAYLGADAVFIPSPEIARAHPDTDILDLAALRGTKAFVGYIYGGIRAFPRRFPYTKSAALYNSGAVPTQPSDLILKVYATPVNHR